MNFQILFLQISISAVKSLIRLLSTLSPFFTSIYKMSSPAKDSPKSAQDESPNSSVLSNDSKDSSVSINMAFSPYWESPVNVSPPGPLTASYNSLLSSVEGYNFENCALVLDWKSPSGDADRKILFEEDSNSTCCTFNCFLVVMVLLAIIAVILALLYILHFG